MPFISNVKANFTQYMLSEVSKMQGAYSVRIYELLTQYKSVGNAHSFIDDLRFMLDLGTRYKTTGILLGLLTIY
jgi:plasmid replication initiation protein